MSEKDSKILSIIASFAFAVLTVGGFFWLYISMNKNNTLVSNNASSYIPIEISSIKKEAEIILSGKQKVGPLPVAAPNEYGKTNPFE